MIWLRSNHILTTFWLQSDYSLNTFWLHSDYILTIFDYGGWARGGGHHELLIYWTLDDHWPKKSIYLRWLLMSGAIFISDDLVIGQIECFLAKNVCSLKSCSLYILSQFYPASIPGRKTQSVICLGNPECFKGKISFKIYLCYFWREVKKKT